MTNSFQRGEIYWADLRPATGSEQDGFRPVLILSNNILNQYSSVVMAAPLTRLQTGKKTFPTNVAVLKEHTTIDPKAVTKLKSMEHYYEDNADSNLYCAQIRAISQERLLIKLGNINSVALINEIDEVIAQVFAFHGCKKCYAPMKKDQLRCGNPKCKEIHRKKCSSCKNVMDSNDRFCSSCGEEA